MDVLQYPPYLQKHKRNLTRYNLYNMLGEIYEDRTKVIAVRIGERGEEGYKKYCVEVEYAVFSEDLGEYYTTFLISQTKKGSISEIEFNDDPDHSGFKIYDLADIYSKCEEYLLSEIPFKEYVLHRRDYE